MNAKAPATTFHRRRSYCLSLVTALALSTSPWSPPFSTLLAQSGQNQTGNDDGIVYWPRLDFVIPFNMDAAGQSPREIQLEFSEDGGRSWGLYSSSDVRAKQFHFKAKEDGEYRFRLKTLDSQGRSFDNPGDPLRVVVDTTKPEAKLLVDVDQRGVMQAEFEIFDSAIDPSTIKLAYQTEGLSQWREIAIELRPGENPTALFGFGSWSLPNGTRQLVVRLTAKDKAGNPVEETRLPQLPRSAAVQGSLQLASGKPRELGGASSRSSDQPIGSGIADPGRDALPKVEVLGRPRAKPIPDNTNPTQMTTQAQLQQQLQFPQQRAQPSVPAVNSLVQQNNVGAELGRPFLDNIERESIYVANRELSPLPKQESPKNEMSLTRLPVREISDEELERFRSQGPVSLVTRPSDMASSLSGGIDLPAIPRNSLQMEPQVTRVPNPTTFHRDIKPLYCNSKAFSLDYGIDNDPDSPVSSVELWGTADEGQSWQMWGQDPDRESPFDIEVETEGLFGFRMVIVGANGLASNRPRNGDNADTWIHDDTQ